MPDGFATRGRKGGVGGDRFSDGQLLGTDASSAMESIVSLGVMLPE